jgi:hypothetical protein
MPRRVGGQNFKFIAASVYVVGGKGTPNTTFMEQAQPCNLTQREIFARMLEEAKNRESETLESVSVLESRIEKELLPKLAQEQAGASELIAKIGPLEKELAVAEKALCDLGFEFDDDVLSLRWNAPAKLQKALEAGKRSARIEREKSLKKFDLAILGVWSAETTGEAKGIVEALL